MISIVVRLGVRSLGMANNDKGEIGAKGSEHNSECVSRTNERGFPK